MDPVRGRTAGPSSPLSPPPESQKSFFGSNRPLLRKGGGSTEVLSLTRRLLNFSFFPAVGPSGASRASLDGGEWRQTQPPKDDRRILHP